MGNLKFPSGLFRHEISDFLVDFRFFFIQNMVYKGARYFLKIILTFLERVVFFFSPTVLKSFLQDSCLMPDCYCFNP